jgi:hypothetical protein
MIPIMTYDTYYDIWHLLWYMEKVAILSSICCNSYNPWNLLWYLSLVIISKLKIFNSIKTYHKNYSISLEVAAICLVTVNRFILLHFYYACYILLKEIK